jgi:hypothetical protein
MKYLALLATAAGLAVTCLGGPTPSSYGSDGYGNTYTSSYGSNGYGNTYTSSYGSDGYGETCPSTYGSNSYGNTYSPYGSNSYGNTYSPYGPNGQENICLDIVVNIHATVLEHTTLISTNIPPSTISFWSYPLAKKS